MPVSLTLCAGFKCLTRSGEDIWLTLWGRMIDTVSEDIWLTLYFERWWYFMQTELVLGGGAFFCSKMLWEWGLERWWHFMQTGVSLGGGLSFEARCYESEAWRGGGISCKLSTYRIYLGLARTAHIHLIWPYVWWSPCQKYRKYTVLVLASPKETLWKEEGGSLPGATVDCMCSLCGCTLYNLAHFVSLLLLYKPTFTYVCSVWVWPTLCVCVLCMSVTHFVLMCALYECDVLSVYLCSVWVWPTLCVPVYCMSMTCLYEYGLLVHVSRVGRNHMYLPFMAVYLIRILQKKYITPYMYVYGQPYLKGAWLHGVDFYLYLSKGAWLLGVLCFAWHFNACCCWYSVKAAHGSTVFWGRSLMVNPRKPCKARLSWCRYLVVWNPLIFMALSCAFHFMAPQSVLPHEELAAGGHVCVLRMVRV